MTQRQIIVDLMVKMRKIDAAGLTQRDVLVIWCVKENPGIEGILLSQKLGFKSRSNVQTNIFRLIRLGFIEDRRAVAAKTVPNILHLLPKGEEFWSDLNA